jgi:hypothetical protein
LQTIESEKKFSDWLFELGGGRSGAIVSLPPSCFSVTQELVEQLCGDINFSTVTNQQLKSRAVLYVTNEDSLEQNSKVLCHMTAEESMDTFASQNQITILHTLKSFSAGMSPHELHLKIGAVIKLRQNVMLSQGLCSGMRLTITCLQRHVCVSLL